MDVKSGLCLCAGPRAVCRPSSSSARVYGRHVRSIAVRKPGTFHCVGRKRFPRVVCAEGDVGVAENQSTAAPSASSLGAKSESSPDASSGEQSDLKDVKTAFEETIGEITGVDLSSDSEAPESVATEASSETTETSVAEGDEGASDAKPSDVSSSSESVVEEPVQMAPKVHTDIRKFPASAKRTDLPFSVGDKVVGMVKWSGNRGAKVAILDTDYEGFCQSRNSPAALRDDVAVEFDLKTSRPMKSGLIRQFKVIAIPDDCSPGGRGPLLAARDIDRGVNDQRLAQIMEICRRDREVIQAHMVGINSGGVKCTLAGIPAFMPRSQCLKDSPEYIEDAEMSEKYVGKNVPVALIGLDRLKQRVVVSESRAKESNAMRGIQPGSLVWGTVRRMQEWGVFVGIDDTQMSCLLHISNISQATVNEITDVFQEGDRVCAVVISMEEDYKRVSLSTADLEESAGDMLVDKEKVYANAPAAVELIQQEIEAQRAQYLEQQEL